jgi:hypothetical protein
MIVADDRDGGRQRYELGPIALAIVEARASRARPSTNVITIQSLLTAVSNNSRRKLRMKT